MGMARAWEQFSRVSRNSPAVKARRRKSKEAGNERGRLVNTDFSSAPPAHR